MAMERDGKIIRAYDPAIDRKDQVAIEREFPTEAKATEWMDTYLSHTPAKPW